MDLPADRRPPTPALGAARAPVIAALAGIAAAAILAVVVWRRDGAVIAASASAPAASDAAAAAPPLDEAGLRALLGDPARLERGRMLFASNCGACHSPTGEGVVGLAPNLTDDHWLHGSDMTDLVRTITDGVERTAMLPWKDRLSADEIRSLAVAVVHLKGTGGDHGRPPDGELRPITYWP